MLSKTELNKLNAIFGDKLGLIPPGYAESGQPRFQYKRMEDLTMLVLMGMDKQESESGLINFMPRYERKEQMSGFSGWCIARWLEPGWTSPDLDGAFGEPDGDKKILSPAEYLERFNALGDLGFEKDGWWMCFQPLREGYTPQEEWTRWAAEFIHQQANLGLRETYYMITDRRKRVEEAHCQEILDSLRDCWHKVPHLSGKRGGSYLAFTEPSQKSIA